MLPFRVESGVTHGRQTTVLRYEGDVVMLDRSKRRQLYSYDLGFVAAEAQQNRHLRQPAGRYAIIGTIQMFVALEEEYDRVAKLAAELAEANSMLAAKVTTLENRVAGYESQKSGPADKWDSSNGNRLVVSQWPKSRAGRAN